MIEFIFVFLVEIKGYSAGKEIDAIAKYNGCQPTDTYAVEVAKNSVKYLAINEFETNTTAIQTLSISDIRQRIKDIADLAFGKTATIVHQFDSLLFGVENHVNHAYTYSKAPTNTKNSFSENAPVCTTRNYNKTFFSNIGFGLPYIYKQADQSLFAYFRGYLSEIVFYHNQIVAKETGKKQTFDQKTDPNFIYLYYETVEPSTGNLHRNFVTNTEQYKLAAKSFAVKSNFEQGKVYIKPGVPIYHYENQMNNLPPSFFVDKVKISNLLFNQENE
ncbi:MAG TPA: hypothetical protein DCQ31_02145 [Bacteroidales bacterium]|nr:hypothetical protein [Bacteroidales bacterium]